MPSPGGRNVASAGRDGTIRFWSVASGREIVGIIAGLGGEWLVVTPDGFFNASPRGHELLTIVRGLEAVTIDQVHQSLFNPDLLREAIAGDPSGEVSAAAKSSAWIKSSTADRHQTWRSRHRSKVLRSPSR